MAESGGYTRFGPVAYFPIPLKTIMLNQALWMKVYAAIALIESGFAGLSINFQYHSCNLHFLLN